jgi:predicted negative regulator of RcsB-dependent stress response
MEEEIQIINQNTRREKFKNFIIKNKKILVMSVSSIIIIILLLVFYSEIKFKNQIKLGNKYNEIVLSYEKKNNQNTEEELIDIIQKKDPTYSPLALNFIIDNEIVNDKIKVNELFDIIIEKTNIENEIKNLIIYKKALYNSDNINENDLINILNPILNSESIWRSHSLYLLAEYFLSKNEKQKSKEFLVQIIELENANPKIKVEAQKRINRDLSD